MNLLRGGEHLAPPYLAIPLEEVTPIVHINEELRAPDAYA
jgi:hypothetical protein